MISLLFVFSVLVAMQVWWMKGMCYYASMITDHMISAKIRTLHLHGWHSWPCWPSTGGREYDQGNALYIRCGLHWLLYSVLVEFMVMWRWENMLVDGFLNWSLKMLHVMCCLSAPIYAAAGSRCLCENFEQQRRGKRCEETVSLHLEWSE